MMSAKLSRGDSLNTYFIDSGQNVLISKPGPKYQKYSSQEIVARLYFNQINYSKSVTDNGGGYFYKHQNRPSGNMITNDSIFLVHGPGTGKTFTQIKIAMDLFTSKIVSKIVIINQSQNGNLVAMRTFNTIFNGYYKVYFRNFTFEQFKKKYISLVTISKMSEFNYMDNSVVIIDEAHNLLTDNDPAMTKNKIENLEKLVDKLSRLSNIKIVLSSATPLFGDETSIVKFRKLMLRNFNETLNEIPDMMISFIKVNYTHLNINMMMNGEFPGHGDFSFTMANGKKYPFKLFVTKPSSFQIADFFNLEFEGDEKTLAAVKKDRFQTYDKPLIVNSKPRGGRTKSAIVAAIASITEQTKDGTSIIYTDILKKGANEIAKILEQYHGYEKFSVSASTKEQQMMDVEIDESLLNRVSAINDEIDDLQSKFFGASLQKLEDFKRDFKEYPTEQFQEFINDYQEKLTHDNELYFKIDDLKKKKKEIHEMISSQMRIGKKSTAKKSYKYIIFSSEMTAEDKKAFEIFNSPKNWNGEIIKTCIISRIGRDGTDIKHVLQTHIVISEWRIPGNIQAQHRGIRNNSHNAIIYNRAIQMKRNMERRGEIITLDEAIAHIEREGIDVEIYYHLMDFDLLDTNDIEEALPYMNETGVSKFAGPKEILDHMQSENNEHKAGRKIYNAAIEHHSSVGPVFSKMVSSSYDFFQNVQKSDRLEFASSEEEEKQFSRDMQNEELFGEGDTELFFIDNFIYEIVKEIKKILIEKTYVNTDEIVDFCLGLNKIYTVKIIVESITALVESGYIYNPKLGINMLVKLWENNNESILYLDSLRDNKSHPWISSAKEVPVSFSSVLDRQKTSIDREDLEFPKNSQVLMKLKDLLERALIPGCILTVNEITFLVQMSNFWSFSWDELEEKKSHKNINIYVFLTHITNPDINILAKDVAVGEYNLITGRWKTLKTGNLKEILFIRGASLINMYKNFDYEKIPELAERYKPRGEFTPSDYNGIIFVKGYYNPDSTKRNLIDRFLSNDGAIPDPFLKNIVVKNYADPSSKGCQVSSVFKKNVSRESVILHLKSIMERSFSMFFFLYDKSNYKGGERVTIFDIKEREKRIIDDAMSGNPTERFKIPAIESLNVTIQRKQEIYRAVFRR